MTTGKPGLTKVVLGTTDVSSYVISWKVKREFGIFISGATIIFNAKILSVFTIDENNMTYDVTIQRGIVSSTEKYIFRGETMSLTKDGVNIVATCQDEFIKAKRVLVVKSWDKNIDSELGVISAIWTSLVNDYAGLTANATVTTKTLNKFISNHVNAWENMKQLADTLDWQMYYDPDTDLSNLEPKGTISQTSTLEVGVNIMNPPKWNYDKTSLVNKFKVIGAEELVTSTELFNGDGAEDTFALAKTPFSVKVTVGATEQVGGNETTSTTFDYQVDDDREVKSIIFEAGSIPGIGVGNISIEYTHLLPRPVILKNPTSMTDNGTFEDKEFKTDLKNIDDAKEYGRAYINRFSTPFVSSTLNVIDVSDLVPGQLVQTVDANNNINSELLVNSVVMTYPYYTDVVEVGDKIIRTETWGHNTDERIGRLEDQFGKSQDLLLHVFDFDLTQTFEPRYHKLETQTIADSFILGHVDNGILGTSKLGSRHASQVIAKLVQGDNSFKEYLYDSTFVDGTSTATIDTTNKRIVF